MASKNKKTGGNHFALLETDDPGDTRLEQPQPPAPASLTQDLFGRAYYPSSAWETMRHRQKQQQGGVVDPPPANAKARADSKKGAQGRQGSSGRKKQQGEGGRHGNGGAAVNGNDAPTPRLYDLAEFPSLK